MGLADELIERTEPIIEQMYHEDFIQGMIHGNLPKKAAKRYLIQDIKYERAIPDLYALLLSKTDDIEVKRDLYQMIGPMLDVRYGVNYILADYIGEDYETVIATDEWLPTADHYVKHMFYNAYRYSDPVYAFSAIAPGEMYSYVRLGNLVGERETLSDDNPLKGWISALDDPLDLEHNVFYKALNKAGETFPEDQIEILRKNYYQSMEHERAFFRMAMNDERWGFERGDY